MKSMNSQVILTIVLALLFNYYSYSQDTVKSVDEFSKVSCYVEIYSSNKFLGNATGFFFSTAHKSYFITNNHVVGGKYYQNDYIQKYKHAAPLDSIPNRLEIRVHGSSLGKTGIIRLPLVNNNKPIYISFNNPSNIPLDIMDVAAIPINNASIDSKDINILFLGPINENRDLVLYPSTELFIVGFPYDYGKLSNYPLWKRGTIASEPNLADNNSDIDATTRSGMSGSPVIFRGASYVTKQGQNYSGVSTFLVGIYSAQNYMAEIGLVWKLSKVIDELNKLDQ